MSRASRRLVLAICAAASAAVHAQAPAPVDRLERLGSEHGLSHNSVYAILQDSHGFLWFGTQDGLDRYDGVELVSYRHAPNAPASLASNWVRALLEDREGRLWVGTRAGLHRMQASGAGFDRIPLGRDGTPEHPTVLSLAEDGHGRVWAATPRGVYRIEADDGATLYAHDAGNAGSIGDGVVHAVRADAGGRVWALTEGPEAFSLNRFDGGGFERFAIPPAYALAFDSSGDLIGPAGSVRASDLVARARDLRFDRAPTAILADSHGRIWVGTFEGLFVRGRADAAVHHVATDHLRAGALAGEVNALFEDRAGTVWIATFAGVIRLDPNRKAFGHIGHVPGDSSSLSADAVSGVVQDRAGRLWVGTYGTGLDEIDADAGRVRHHRARANEPAALCGDYIWDVAEARSPAEGVWVATVEGLCRVMPGGRVDRHRLLPACTNALTLVEDAAGALWLGTHAGLCRYEPLTGLSALVVPAGRAELAPVDTVHIDETGRIWMGSAGGGPASLASFDPIGGIITPYPDATDAAVWDIDSAGDGRLWLATGGGLVHFDPASGGATRLAQPGPGAVHYSVVRDEAGVVWTGTNKGLVSFDPATGATRHFDTTDGIGSIEFNRHAVWKGRSGELFFGGMRGVTRFVPARLGGNAHPPPVELTSVRLLGRQGERVLAPAPGTAVRVEPGDAAVTFEFAALSFTQSHKNRYAYRLDGFDAAWIDAGTARTARYTNLPPGTYTMRVRAANNDGVWNETGAALPVVVVPAWWQAWWLRAAAFGLLVAGLTMAYRWRVKRLVEIERLRLRIASDLHDELGSELSGMAVASSLVDREGRLSGRDRERLSQVSAAATRVMEGLRDIVWHINPEHDTIASLEARIRAVAATLLADLPHEVRTGGVHPSPVSMDVRRHVLLIYKELLTNIVRHANARRVEIAFEASGGSLRLEVGDDGAGFAEAAGPDGTGLGSIKRRAAEIGAALTVDSTPGRGTRVTLVVPLPRTRHVGSRRRRLG